MLTGFSGHLVSEAFLERTLTDAPPGLRHRFVQWRARCAQLGPASSLRAMLEVGAQPFVQRLGFSPMRDIDWRPDAVSASLDTGRRPTALFVTRWADPLDSLWRAAVLEARRRSAAWSLLFNGRHVRLIEAERVYSRRFLEFDLDLAIDDERTFDALWSVFQSAMFSAGAGDVGIAQLVNASERYASGVCRSLRDGVLDASAAILAALMARPATCEPNRSFQQALTIVYRIVFLLFAEGRGLVPMWHPVYRDSYSMAALCTEAERGESMPGLWDWLRAVSRLAHSGCQAGDLRMTSFNGRLFAPAETPLAERRDLDNGAARRAILALATRPAADGSGRERIAYRDLGVEQIGAVYETLLDYQPRTPPSTSPRQPGRVSVSLETGTAVRKSTGTFYTPQPLAEFVVRRALGPLVHERSPEHILQLKILDPAMGSGAFLVAACGFLAHAYEAALLAAGRCHASDLGPQERLMIRRTIAERCLFGIDINPMAVQLARLSIWLAALAGDRPLSFLDHHLRRGNSVLGAWLTNLRRPPTSRRQRAPVSLPLLVDSACADTLRRSLPVRFALADTPNDTLAQVREKERALAALQHRDTALSKWKRVADLWCSHWFTDYPPAAFHSLADRTLTGQSPLPEETADRYLRAAEAAAESHGLFHWELEFPEVFFDSSGHRLTSPGFDAVVGNPPWRMIRSGREARDGQGDDRGDMARIVRFTRDAGVYESHADGHANLYQLFVERAVALTRPEGRIGLVLPTGFIADQGSTSLRRLVFSRAAVDGVVGFDNRMGIFPIHRSVRFLTMTATGGRPTTRFGCRLGERTLDAVGAIDHPPDSWFPLQLTPELLERLSGPSLAVPDVRSTLDLTIASRAAGLFPPLGDPGGWNARFGRELNATENRRVLKATNRGLPVLEGKHVEPFRANLLAPRLRIAAEDARRLLNRRPDRARLAYRDVASSTNRQTLIAAILPSGCASTHTLFCLRTRLSKAHQHFLCGMFNSFVVNYLVRLRVSIHVTTAIVERLPIPTAAQAGLAVGEISTLARLLSRSARPELFARLNARVAQLYQLSPAEFGHVLDTFPLVPREVRDATLRALLHLTQA